MARFSGSVLLDNNAIGAALDAGAWPALAGGYKLETVEEVAEEAGTYFRKFANHVELASAFEQRVTVNSVSDSNRATLLVKTEGIALDDGERDLWAHALQRRDDWILCGPDKASMRTALRLGLRDRVVSLEKLLRETGVNVKDLPRQYTEAWLQARFTELMFDEGKS